MARECVVDFIRAFQIRLHQVILCPDTTADKGCEQFPWLYLHCFYFLCFLLDLCILKKISGFLCPCSCLPAKFQFTIVLDYLLHFFLNSGLLVYYAIRGQSEKSTFVLICYSSHPPLCWGFNQGLCQCYNRHTVWVYPPA